MGQNRLFMEVSILNHRGFLQVSADLHGSGVGDGRIDGHYVGCESQAVR